MSSPIDRSSDPNEASFYAPKWAHSKTTDLRVAGGSNTANNAPTDIPILEWDNHQHSKSLEPTLVPEPPELELRHRGRVKPFIRANNGVGMFIGIPFAIFLAGLVAFGFVVALPTIQSFIAAPSAIVGLGLKRSDAGPELPARPLTTAHKPTPTPANPWLDGQQSHALTPPANVLGVFNFQTGPTQFAIDRLAWINPNHASLPDAHPRLAAAAPPVAGARQSESPASTTNVKAVPARTEPARSLDREEIETLLNQGVDFVAVGDFASARFIFGRVAEAGDARGALALAATYDPVALAKNGPKGATPDEAKARAWYQKAKDLGSVKAAPRLEALTNSAQ